MKRLLFYLKLFFFFLFFSVTISAVETSFFYPYVDFNRTQYGFSSFSGSVADVNTYLENTFPELGVVSVKPLVDMNISTAYKTSVFIPEGVGSFSFIINYSFDNTIISAVKFLPYFSKFYAGYDRYITSLLSFSDSNLYYFKDNVITHYLISSTGVFTLDNTLTIESSWELSLIDDMFPSLSALYLILPFNVSTVVSEVNSLVSNLNLKIFGIAGDDLVFTFSDFAASLSSHCDRLKFLFLGQSSNENYSAASQINSNCSSLASILFIQYNYFNDNQDFSFDLFQLFESKVEFFEF